MDLEEMNPEEAVLRAASTADLLAAVPYLLRFHPDNSLVLILTRDHRVLLSARVDLGPEIAAMGEFVGNLGRRHGADEVRLVAYADNVAAAGRLLDELIAGIEGVRVAEAVVADGYRYWSRLCACPKCCGRSYEVATSEFAARATVAGLPALPNRRALARKAAGPDAEREPEVRAAFEEVLPELADLGVRARQDRLAAVLDRFLDEPWLLSTRERAELAVLSYDVAVRSVAEGSLRRANAAVHVDLWSQVVQGSVAPFEMAPLCLLGLASWVDGNGALQVICIERGERINPGYSLLRTLSRINARALSPLGWDDALAQSRVESGAPVSDGPDALRPAG